MEENSNVEQFRGELGKLVRSQMPLIHVSTFEESRALDAVLKVVRDIGRHVLMWSTVKGVINPDKSRGRKADTLPNADLVAAIQAFEQSMKNKKAAEDGMVFILLDPCPYLNERGANPIYRRKLREFANEIRENGWKASCVVITPEMTVPYELEREVTVIDFPLPTRSEIRAYIQQFIKTVSENGQIRVIDDVSGLVERLTEAAIGLSQRELENALAFATIDDLRLDSSDVRQMFRQKRQTVRKSGMLDFIETENLSLDNVGGLERLKSWLMRRRDALSQDGADFGLTLPKGVLLTGVPGCGKSLSAKCVAASWELPLLRLDMGRVFSSLVGASEERMRHAIQIAEAVAPCVVWIDEIEKGLHRPGEHIGDSGVSMRVLGTFLTWLQEKQSAVFVVATANEIRQLPPEMLRKGRFDGIFFVDLPTPRERADILRIHLARTGRAGDEIDVDRLVELSGSEDISGQPVGMTGAEIAAWVDDAMLLAFGRARDGDAAGEVLTMADFSAALDEMSLLTSVRSSELVELRYWGSTHAQPASLTSSS